MRKKILTIIAAAAVVVAMIPSMAFADTDYEAEINGVGYDTLQQAVDNANTGDTVKVLKDINVVPGKNTYPGKDNIFVAFTKEAKITLDLNGKTIKWSLTDEQKENEHLNCFTFYLRPGADVTVTGNGTVNELDGGEYHAFTLGGEGNVALTIENGTFCGCEAVIIYDKDKSGSRIVTINGGTFVKCLTVGSINHSCHYNQILNLKGNGMTENTKIMMYGGTLVGVNPHNMEDGDMVADGCIVQKDGDDYTTMKAENLTSGVYVSDPSELLADGYYISNIDKENGLWTVSAKEAADDPAGTIGTDETTGSDKPTDSDADKTVNSVETGDSMNMAFPLVIAGLALAAMAAVVMTRRRHN